jgi:hypothetical protein
MRTGRPVSEDCSMNTTGSSSKIDAVSSPYASSGFDGWTTLRPGLAANQPSSWSQCWAPIPLPAPPIVLMVIGTELFPAVMYRTAVQRVCRGGDACD